MGNPGTNFMRICFFSNFFLPRIGGVERATHTLAEGWSRMGHEVHVVTDTPVGDHPDHLLPYKVIRPPLQDPSAQLKWPPLFWSRQSQADEGRILTKLQVADRTAAAERARNAGLR